MGKMVSRRFVSCVKQPFANHPGHESRWTAPDETKTGLYTFTANEEPISACYLRIGEIVCS